MFAYEIGARRAPRLEPRQRTSHLKTGYPASITSGKGVMDSEYHVWKGGKAAHTGMAVGARRARDELRRGDGAQPRLRHCACVPAERDFFIDNLLVRIHFIIVMIRWTGLAPWEFEFPFPGSLTCTCNRHHMIRSAVERTWHIYESRRWVSGKRP